RCERAILSKIIEIQCVTRKLEARRIADAGSIEEISLARISPDKEIAFLVFLCREVSKVGYGLKCVGGVLKIIGYLLQRIVRYLGERLPIIRVNREEIDRRDLVIELAV